MAEEGYKINDATHAGKHKTRRPQEHSELSKLLVEANATNQLFAEAPTPIPVEIPPRSFASRATTPASKNISESMEGETLRRKAGKAEYHRRLRDLKRRIEEANSDIKEQPPPRRTRVHGEAPQRDSNTPPRYPKEESIIGPPYGLPAREQPTYYNRAYYNRRIDPVEIKFSGDTWINYMDFAISAELLFLEVPWAYPDDESKVLGASRGLEGRAKQEWEKLMINRELEEQDALPTWTEFLRFCEGLFGSEDTRVLSAASKIRALQQKPETSFKEHINTWEIIEAEAPFTLPLKPRMALFIDTLRAELKLYLTRGGLPASWQELRVAGERFDAVTR